MAQLIRHNGKYPAIFFTTIPPRRPAAGQPHRANNLQDSLAKQLLIIPRDDRTFWGWLRALGQCANLFPQAHSPAPHSNGISEYADVYFGKPPTRRGSVCVFGEIDPDRDSGGGAPEPARLLEAPLEKVLRREADIDAESAARCTFAKSSGC